MVGNKAIALTNHYNLETTSTYFQSVSSNNTLQSTCTIDFFLLIVQILGYIGEKNNLSE